MKLLENKIKFRKFDRLDAHWGPRRAHHQDCSRAGVSKGPKQFTKKLHDFGIVARKRRQAIIGKSGPTVRTIGNNQGKMVSQFYFNLKKNVQADLR